MDRGAWRATVHGVAKELNITQWINNNNATDNNTLGCDGDGRTDCIRQADDFEALDDNILDEFSQTEEFMSGQYISEGRMLAGI